MTNRTKPALPEPQGMSWEYNQYGHGEYQPNGCFTAEQMEEHTRAAIDAAVAEARAQMQERIDDQLRTIKALMVGMPDEGTTPVIRRIAWLEQQLAEARAVPVAHVEETPAGPKLYVNGVCVRWELGCVHDAAFHELARRINSTNPSPTEPPACARWAEARAVPEDIEAIVACLGDDAATLLDDNPECEIAANMIAAAQALEALSATPSPIEPAMPAEQPKPARVAMSDEQIKAAERASVIEVPCDNSPYGTIFKVDLTLFARAVIAEYERLNGITCAAQGGAS